MTVENGMSTAAKGGGAAILSPYLMEDPRVTHCRQWNKMMKKMRN